MLQELTRDDIDAIQERLMKGELDPDAFYRQQAIANASEKYDSNHLMMLGGVGLGLVAFPFIGLFGALGLMLCAGQSAYNRSRKGTQVIQQIESGEADLEEYLDREHKRFYRKWREMNAQKALPPAKRAPQIESSEGQEDAAIAHVSDEMPVPAQYVDEEMLQEPNSLGDATEGTAQTVVTAQNARTAMQEILKAPLYTRIFLGGQRSGKSYGVSQVSRYLQQQNGTKVFAINLALVKNPEYWDHADRKAIADLTAADVDKAIAIQAIKEARAVLEEFKRHKNALLLIDEWTIIGATTFKFNEQLKPFIDEVCSTITTLSSRGLQASQAVWLIAPHCRLDFLERSAKALKLCKLCLVAANPVQPFSVDGNQISFDWELFDQVKNNWRDIVPPEQGIDSLSTERIAFINGQWMPLGNVSAPTSAEHQPIATPSTIPAHDAATDDLADKLLSWLQGTGQKYGEDGWMPAPALIKYWRFKRDGKTQALNKDELLPILEVLVLRKQVTYAKGKGIKAV